MSRNPAPFAPAFVFAATLALAGTGTPAQAWPFGGAKPSAQTGAQTGAQTSSQTASTAPGAARPDAPRKATAEERAAAAKLDPLVRAAFWQRELEVDPADAQAGLGLSAALRALGKYDEAADAADRVSLIAPRNEEALLESARDHIAAGRGFYALAPLKAAEALAPKDWRPVSLTAVALEQSQRPDEALAAYGQALSLSPDNPAVLSNLALFYATRGDTPRAESLLRRAAAQPTATAQERQNLALVLGLEGKTAEAEHLMRQDLPPETADANLAYVRSSAADRTSPGGADLPPVATPARTWTSVEQSDAKGGG